MLQVGKNLFSIHLIHILKNVKEMREAITLFESGLLLWSEVLIVNCALFLASILKVRCPVVQLCFCITG
jgi:hypothetical protein